MLKYWIWMSSVCTADVKTKLKVLKYFGAPKEVFFACEADLRKLDFISNKDASTFADKRLHRAYEILEQCAEKNIDVMTIQDARYPERLRNIDNPPLVLYVKGRLPAVDEEAAIAIVGTRHCTPYGTKNARRIGYELARAGALVVSGLAAGIDSSGALGAIEAGCPVVGVLGCNIDEVYPKSNVRLYDDVQQVGALVSEYPPGHKGGRMNFPARNRIISGLSAGVVIIEAPERSGALITASLALEQGRELFVVPGNIDSDASKGSNKLLSESAAKAVISSKDVLSEFEGLFSWKLRPNKDPDSLYLQEDSANKTDRGGAGFVKKSDTNEQKMIDREKDKGYIDLREQLEGLSDDELIVVSKISASPEHIDDIIELCGIPASRVLSAMTMLQIKGHVTEYTGKRFSLNIIKK